MYCLVTVSWRKEPHPLPLVCFLSVQLFSYTQHVSLSICSNFAPTYIMCKRSASLSVHIVWGCSYNNPKRSFPSRNENVWGISLSKNSQMAPEKVQKHITWIKCLSQTQLYGTSLNFIRNLPELYLPQGEKSWTLRLTVTHRLYVDVPISSKV